METFDLIVIGAGPSGYAAAMRALDFGKKVLLVEKNEPGGAGVLNGALSSKTWWELSRDIFHFRDKSSIWQVNLPTVSWSELRQEVLKATEERKETLQEHLQCLLRKLGPDQFQYWQGEAHLLEQELVSVKCSSGEQKKARANRVILATGSRPRHLPDIPVDEERILTSDGIENLEDFPKSLVIVGAGVIGCEFATIFANQGKTKVYLIDKGDRILPFEDDDIVSIIESNLESQGVHVHRKSRLKDLQPEGDHVRYTLEFEDGREESFEVEKALISVGRVPNFEKLWSDAVPIEINKRGIQDYDTQTNISGIYAVGDLTADINLVNVAELEGRYAVEKIFGHPKHSMVYENISTIMFLHPEVAGVGLNEQQAKEKGINYRVAKLDYRCIPRAIAKRNTQGFIKLLVNTENQKILGMRVIGEQSSSAIQAIALLISTGQGVEALAECVHPHPSITEGIQECARLILGNSILKPGYLAEHAICQCWDGARAQ